ncbi:MAG: c-type cytochrome [Flavobacteriales bacterium]|nr:c-type cytochrome [Flavobacteriales bacterium]
MKKIAQNIRKAALIVISALAPAAMMAQMEEAQPAGGEHFGIPDGVLIVVLVSMAVLLSIIILIINSSIRNIAETKGFWKGKNMDKMMTLVGLFTLTSVAAHAATEENTSVFVLDDASFWGLVVVNFVLILIAMYQVYILRKLTDHVRGYHDIEPAYIEKGPSMLGQLWAKMQASVPVEKEADVMLDHEYDGIHELDNVLPPWWKYGFYLTIIVGVIYMFHYHVLETGPLMIEELEMANEEAAIAIAEYESRQANKVDENTLVFEDNATFIASGKEIFQANCISCHAVDGGGINGPNFTDQYWIYGGDIKNIYHTIKYGATRGMQPWQTKLSAGQMRDVAFYVYTLEGTTPANPKAPEGELYERSAGGDESTPEEGEATEEAPVEEAAAETAEDAMAAADGE